MTFRGSHHFSPVIQEYVPFDLREEFKNIRRLKKKKKKQSLMILELKIVFLFKAISK